MITLKNCFKQYNKNKIGIRDVNLKLPSTGMVGIFGDSGSGKSTLINCLGGLDKFTSGELYIDNVPIQDLGEYSTYIFQEFKLLESLTVWENILFSLDKNIDKLDSILSQLKILDIKHDKVNSISGGQRQRVAIARALIKDVPIIICDEPTASLDNKTSHEIFSLLKNISNKKLILIVSHQIEILKNYTNNIVKIEHGNIIEAFDCMDNSLSQMNPIPETKLLNKNALKLGWINACHNKVKAIMTCVFLFIALTLLAILTTILSIDLDKVSYYTYKKNNMEYVQFQNDIINNANLSTRSISSQVVHQLNPDIICYNNINFKFLYQENIEYIHTAWITQNDFYENIHLNTNEVILSTASARLLSNDISSLISKCITTANGDLIIKEVFDNDNESIIVMTNSTLENHNSNLLESSLLSVEFENAYLSYRIYDSYNKNIDGTIEYGDKPVNKNEACLPLSLLKKIFPNVDAKTLIGQTITLDFYLVAEAKIKSEELLIKGYTDNSFIFPDEFLSSYISQYGSASITSGTRNIIYFDYTIKTFKNATNNYLIHQGQLSDKIYAVYFTIKSFFVIVIVFAIIFAIITLFTIVNNVSTSMLKSKKDLGVLICFKIKQKTLQKIFIFENAIYGIFASTSSIIMYIFLLYFINNKISKEWGLNFVLLRFNLVIVLLLLISSILLIYFAIFIPLKRLANKCPLDILYER